MAPTVPAEFTEELTLSHDIAVGHGCIELLMRTAGVKGLPGNKRARSKHQTPTASDLVDRTFTRDEPNKLWVTDITEHPTREGKIYCAAVLDTFSRRVVGLRFTPKSGQWLRGHNRRVQ